MIPTSYQQRIMLDRYAIKDPHAEPKPGDLVVVSLDRISQIDGSKIESREIGEIAEVQNGSGPPLYDVQLATELAEGLERSSIEVIVERTAEEIYTRLANAICLAETDLPPAKEGDDRPDWQRLRELLADPDISPQHRDKIPIIAKFRDDVFGALRREEFVAAGRVQAGLGQMNKDLTLFNCYILPRAKDSRSGITHRWGEKFEIFSRGGGVGSDGSSLRPKGAVIEKINGRSSGSVSWMEQWSQITGAVEQGGSRRGASLLALQVWHPDIEWFIRAKAERETVQCPHCLKTHDRLTKMLNNANISVLISDDFMEAVNNDDDWNLVFPDTSHEDYDEVWNGDLRAWEAPRMGHHQPRPVKVYKTIKARELWMSIIQRAWEAGEPGLLFIDRAEKMSNSSYYAPMVCSNPCGEQITPENSICDLGHLNLSKFVSLDAEHCPDTARTMEEAIACFDLDRYREVIRIGVRFLDNVTDLEKYFIPEIEKRQKSERRIGLGVLGYGEMLARLGLRYGSEQAIGFTDWLFRELAVTSYLASVDLAKEKGSFDLFDADRFLDSGFLRGMPPEVRDAIREHGIRNVALNTVAPTGTVGTRLGTTTAIEPFISLTVWIAQSRIGEARDKTHVVDMIADKFGEDRTVWPDYLVAIPDITPAQHVKTQAAAQRWIDASISKTVNLPNSATVEDVAETYQMMYDLGCKGGTVYRSGSRDKQVIYYEEKGDGPVVEYVSEAQYEQEPAAQTVRPRIESGWGPILSRDTPVGRIHMSIRHHPDTDEPYDVFINSGKGDVGADVQAIARLISMILRWPDNTKINQRARLEMIRTQLYRIPGRSQVGFGEMAVHSLPDGVSNIIQQYLNGDYPTPRKNSGTEREQKVEAPVELSVGESQEDTNGDEFSLYYDICPACHTTSFLVAPGRCSDCKNCGFSSC